MELAGARTLVPQMTVIECIIESSQLTPHPNFGGFSSPRAGA